MTAGYKGWLQDYNQLSYWSVEIKFQIDLLIVNNPVNCGLANQLSPPMLLNWTPSRDDTAGFCCSSIVLSFSTSLLKDPSCCFRDCPTYTLSSQTKAATSRKQLSSVCGSAREIMQWCFEVSGCFIFIYLAWVSAPWRWEIWPCFFPCQICI